MMKKKLIAFRKIIRSYYRSHGRDFPWRRTRDPYRILVSEFMLQQTQTERVKTKYESFLKKFSTVRMLAKAPVREILKAWQGLGYNRRALALYRCAQVLQKQYGGKIPSEAEALDALPGIGQSTAGALAAFAFNKPAVFIETNIRRVFLHHFFPGQHGVGDEEIRKIASEALDRRNPREWYYALMDYGVHLARTMPNPNRRSRHYARQSRFEGSHRQLRGQVLKMFLAGTIQRAPVLLPKRNPHHIREVIRELKHEGFI